MFNYNEIFNAPTLKEIYPDAQTLAGNLKELVTSDFYKYWISNPEAYNTDLQTNLQADLNNQQDPFLNSSFTLMFKNLLNVFGNHKIVTDEEQFKADFMSDLMEKLPTYTAFFNNYNLDPLKSKTGFNDDGVSSYSGSQNTENKMNDIKNFDNYNLNTYTPEELEKQQKLRSIKINEFVYSFEYLFNGVK